MSILFCTSFNKELYTASGSKLINSFRQHQPSSKLVAGVEGIDMTNLPQELELINLDIYSFLQDWLKVNKDIIPKYLGGEALPCNCPTPMQRKPETHSKGCRYNWFNRNCSRWFKKIATLHYTYYDVLNKSNKYKYLIWIDSDCEFKKEIKSKLLNEIFEKDRFSVFYMRGTRSIPETGVFGFNLEKSGAHNFIKQYFHYYISKKFKMYHRWDDSNIFYRILKEKTAANCIARDIVPHNTQEKHVDVLEYSLLKKYLIHKKGLHGIGLGIMK